MYENNGGAGENNRTVIAKAFHQALLNSDTDLLMADMTIMGDPYYIADSGMGNYSNSQTGFFNVTNTGSMNYQTGEVDILVNFKTPIDIGNDGIMNFGGDINAAGFSGLYQVLRVSNKWNRGRFTQDVKLSRRPMQDSDKITNPTQTQQKVTMQDTTLPPAPSEIVEGGALTTDTSGFESNTNSATVDPKSSIVGTVIESVKGFFEELTGDASPDEKI
jgi:hypothetical protein